MSRPRGAGSPGDASQVTTGSGSAASAVRSAGADRRRGDHACAPNAYNFLIYPEGEMR
jgi:hypothetical protein